MLSNKAKYAGRRADGLVASQMMDGSIFTASLEGKSSRAFADFRLQQDDRKRWYHAFLGAAVLFTIAVFLVSPYSDHWFWHWVFPVIIFVLSLHITATVTKGNRRCHKINVFDQLKQYPANEQWPALSTDAYNKLPAGDRRAFLHKCDHLGFGFIRVSRGPKVFLEKGARFRNTPRGYADFLECYSGESQLRYQLQMVDLDLAGEEE